MRKCMQNMMFACIFNGTDNTVPFDVRLYADDKFSVGMFTVSESWHFNDSDCKSYDIT